ncbi:Cof-type HAD-IIB family hydrolase [Paenibacillus sp. PL91]|uniref:Cof-type HAD-IIB family hydrolase n=1 Tax=Paenibacillus sp. PL91 TaxID=2729538 RepID=UPI00145D379D|nr:Cof-type HAD-IIB family hydrolase [Paenibacillus sp. PL91]MBC9199089.1 Cof-type HAD-IIB family hydrolase [Paenibacillus sp. PL91]
MTKKLIFFDIDGTLVDHEKKIPASTEQAIAELMEAGHEVVIATGRGPFMLKPVSEALNIKSYVSFNGSYVVYNDEVVYSHSIDPDRLAELSQISIANKHPLVFMTPEGMRSSTDQTAYVDDIEEALRLKLPPLEPDYYIGRDIYQCLLYCKEEDEGYYKQNFAELGFIRWHVYGSDLLPPGGSKARGIQAIIERAGFNDEDVYAFGDGINDLEMLQYVHHSVAMGNSPDVVKQAARYVTKDVSEDGILFGLRMVGLLKD